MAFKLVVLVASFAYASAGLLGGVPVAHYSSAPDVSSVYSSIGAPSVLAHSAPSVLTHSAPISSVSHGVNTYQAAAPVAQLAYSSAPSVSSVYSSIGHPSVLAHSALPLAHSVAYSSPAIGSSQQQTIRSAAGTISQYSKAVDTAHSSVRKYDTRISNKGYALAPAIAHQSYVAAPALAHQSYVASPALAHQSYVAAPALADHSVVNHVSFNGLGAHYAW